MRLRRRRRLSPRLRLTPQQLRRPRRVPRPIPSSAWQPHVEHATCCATGLDYLNYQEYERALKYFREAETRQKELNEAERLSLKQGIERAQRGLREAVGSETPYALSKRSRRAGGFAAAKPDSQIAAASSSSAQHRSAAATPRITNREGDEQGEPVRLARAEIASTSAAASAAVASPEPIPGEMPKPLPLTSDQPAQLPEIPKLPQVSETADLPAAVVQTTPGATAEAAHPVPLAGNDGQQNQAVTPAPAGLAFPEQAKLHEALRQPPPSVAAAPVSTASDARSCAGAGNHQARCRRTGAGKHEARCRSGGGSG